MKKQSFINELIEFVSIQNSVDDPLRFSISQIEAKILLDELVGDVMDFRQYPFTPGDAISPEQVIKIFQESGQWFFRPAEPIKSLLNEKELYEKIDNTLSATISHQETLDLIAIIEEEVGKVRMMLRKDIELKTNK